MLPPGSYTFRVTAYNNSMVRTNKDLAIPIIVKKAWYFSNLALVIYALLIFLVFYLIVNVKYSQKLRIKNNELDKLNSKLKELTIKDTLTNCFNRLYFEKNYIKEFHRSRRASQPIAILFIDIDDFKEINDSLGHEVGDTILIKVAKALNTAIQRETDFVARYGGDEFIAVLYNTNSQGVDLVIKRIKDGMEGITETEKKTTISIGVHVGIPDSHTNSRMMLIEADKALYKAKKNGKNRTEYSINSF
jgi:diguanylate cyclase (GGDEF)-like protein